MIVMSASSEESWGVAGCAWAGLDEYEVHKIPFTSMINMEVLNQKVYGTALLGNGAGKGFQILSIEHDRASKLI